MNRKDLKALAVSFSGLSKESCRLQEYFLDGLVEELIGAEDEELSARQLHQVTEFFLRSLRPGVFDLLAMPIK